MAMPTIIDATRALWKSDPSITPEQAKAALDVLTGKADIPIEERGKRVMDYSMSRDEVAKVLNVRPHTVSDYVRKGLIRAFRFGAKGRLASGYSAQSVNDLLAGKTNTNGKEVA